MKKLLLHILVSLIFCTVSLFAQNYCDQPGLFSTDQDSGTPEEYLDILYKTAVTYQDEPIDLKADIRVPPNLTEKRPLVITIHGGAFLNIPGNGNSNGNAYSEKAAIELAKKGFVTADIGYRLGWKDHASLPCWANYTNGEKSFKAAYHRALQDVVTAIHFFETNADTYNIDVDNIFLLGRSAGAILSLAAVYTQENELDPEFVELLGGLDGSVNIKGIVAVSGSLLNLQDLTSGEQIPSLMIHGTCDHIVPYDSENFIHVIDNCDALLSHGSHSTANHMDSLNIPYQLFELCGAGHGFSNDALDGTIIAAAAFFKERILCNQMTDIFQERYSYSVDWLTDIGGGCFANDFLDCHDYGVAETWGETLFTETVEPTNTAIASIQEPSIKVYPNPTTDLLFVETQTPLKQIELYNILGNLIYKEIEPSQDNILDMSNLVSGIYYLTLESDNEVIAKKIVVE